MLVGVALTQLSDDELCLTLQPWVLCVNEKLYVCLYVCLITLVLYFFSFWEPNVYTTIVRPKKKKKSSDFFDSHCSETTSGLFLCMWGVSRAWPSIGREGGSIMGHTVCFWPRTGLMQSWPVSNIHHLYLQYMGTLIIIWFTFFVWTWILFAVSSIVSIFILHLLLKYFNIKVQTLKFQPKMELEELFALDDFKADVWTWFDCMWTVLVVRLFPMLSLFSHQLFMMKCFCSVCV